MGLLGRLKAKGRQIVLSKILAAFVTKLAEGDFGEWPKKLYWRCAGAKTNIGFAFGAAWAFLEYGTQSGFCASRGWDCTALANTLGAIAAVLVPIGLFDGALRSKAPNKYAGLLVLLMIGLPLAGCASMGGAQAQIGIGIKGPKSVDQGVVETLACRGDIEAAEIYAQDRGASRAEVTEVIERARKAVAKRPGCCAAEGKCSQ